jgi:hypothetical protein
LKTTSSFPNKLWFWPEDIPIIRNAQYDVTHNIPLSQRLSKKTKRHLENTQKINASIEEDVSNDIFMSQRTLVTPQITT